MEQINILDKIKIHESTLLCFDNVFEKIKRPVLHKEIITLACCFIPVSLAHVVSSLAYPNLLGTKSLVVVVVVPVGLHGPCLFTVLSATLHT
jgi:hypothetical protein